MPGIRIHHRSFVSKVLTMVDQRRPYSTPFECPMCHLTHVFKTYHISLDSDGFAIVSPVVWEKLQQLRDHGFEQMNVVEKPPTITVAVGFAGQASIIDQTGKEIVSGNT